jgi:hypothetical protein
VTDTVRSVRLFLDLPSTTHPEFSSVLFQSFSESAERDYGLKSPLTTELVKRHLRQRKNGAGLGDELEKSGTRIVVARKPYGRYKQFAAPEQVIVFLRDPVARVVAHWETALAAGEFAGSLLEFARAPGNRNLQSRFLQGTPLKQLGFLGWSERFGASYRSLRQLPGFGSLPAAFATEHRIGVPAHRLTAEERAQIETWNDDDVALYRRAQKLGLGVPAPRA